MYDGHGAFTLQMVCEAITLSSQPEGSVAGIQLAVFPTHQISHMNIYVVLTVYMHINI